MSLYLLDTNIISFFLRARHPQLIARVVSESVGNICLSAVSEAEIRFGLAKVGHPAKLTATTHAFFQTAHILPWNSETAAAYAKLKLATQRKGLGIAPLDLMIASQALASDAILVTNDGALKRAGHLLTIEDWTEQ